MKMEVTVHVPDRQTIQEPTIKNGSLEESERDPNLEVNKNSENNSIDNGSVENNLKTASKCDGQQSKMELHVTSAEVKSDLAVDYKTQNGPTFKGNSSEQMDKCAVANEIKQTQNNSENVGSLKKNNGNVAVCVTSSPFMSSIDAVIHSVAHNVPDEPNELEQNSASSKVSDPHFIQEYNHPPHASFNHVKQMNLPQPAVGERTFNPAFPQHIYQHGYPNPQALTSSVSNAIHGKPSTSQAHHPSASEQLSSLVKTHVLESGSDQKISNSQSNLGLPPGQVAQTQPNIPVTLFYNNPSMSNRQMLDPNTGLPLKTPTADENTLSHVQRQALNSHSQLQNEIPSVNQSRSEGNKSRAPPKSGARRPPRPSQARNQDMMRPRMMPEHMNRGMRPMMDPRMMNYFTPENIRMLQQRFPDPRMMPPQLLQHMQQFARMHQAAQQQQQAHSQHPQIAHAPGNPVLGPQQAHSQPSQTPPNLTQPLHASHPNSGEGQAPQIAHSGNIHQGILNRPPLHMLPPHLQPMPHGNMPPATANLHNQVHHSQAQVSHIPHGRPTECESGPLTTGPGLSSDIHNSTALASSSAPHLPTGEGLSRPPSAGGLNRPSSVGATNRPPSVGRPPSAGRPASVGRTSASGSRPPSVGRPTSAEPPPNRPPSVNRTPPASNRPPSADPLSRPSSANQPPSISQPEVAKTPPVASIHQMSSGIQEPIMSTNIEKSMPSTSSIPSSTQTDSIVNMNSSIPSSSSQTSQSQMMTSAITQTPYADETSEEPPGDSTSQKNTSGQPSGNATTTAPSSQPNMPPPFMHSTSVAPMPTGYVQTPFGMLPHHPPMMTQAGGVPYSGVNGPRMMPPRMQIPANMRMPGFPPGFPMPSHMQRMPPHHGTQLSPNSMQAMASLAQQMQVPVSGQSVRPGMPNQPAMGPRGMNPGMPPSSMPTPPFDMFRMSFPMGAQQHPHRPSNMPAGESIPRGPRPKGPRQQRPMAPLQTSPCAEEGLNSPGLSMAGMMPNQLGNHPPDVPGQPIHSQPRPPSIGIASLPSSSPIDSATPSPKIPPTPPGGIDPAVLAEMMRTTQVKQEPNDSTCKTGLSQEEIDQQRNNLLLKKLLAAKNAAKVNQQMSVMSEVGVPKKEADDSVTLTAEQQKQLELIEKMPYVMESEMSTEDWDSKTPEERENIIEMKKQAYEQKRKEFENLRKQKRKQAAAENKKRKRKEKEAIEGQVLVDPTQQPPPPKKRQRKKKQPESLEEDREAKAEHFLQMLRTLPQVLLQEPKVGNFFNVTPVPGSPMVITGEKCLKGSFGKSYLEGVADFYGNTLLQGLPPLGSFVRLPGPRDIESRRKFLGVGKDETPPEQQRYQLVQDRFPLPQQTQQPFHLPGLSPILGRGDKPADPTLPPPPRIEPKLDMMYRGSDSPCTVISSSSPEHEFGDFEDENFPMLKPIDPPTSSEDRLSPLVPILQPIAVKTQEVAVKENQTEIKSDPEAISKPVIDQDLAEKKLKTLTEKENVNGKMPPNLSALTRPFRDANLNQDISVTLTLSANAAEDIGGVLSQIAELLKIAVPPSYEVSRSPSPEQFKMNMKHREEPVNIHSLIKSKAKFCRLCDSVVYDSGFRKKKCDIPFLAKEDYISFKDFDDEEVTFCGEKCYTQFATIYQEIKKPPPELREDYGAKTYFGLSTPKMHMMSDMISPRSMGTLTPTTPTKSDSTLTLTPSTPNSAGALTPVQPSPPIKSRLDDKLAKKHRRTDSIESVPKPMVKKWKNIRYKRWDPSFTASLPHVPGVPEKEIQNLWKVLGTIIVPKPLPEDTRKCCFCQQYGDGETDGPGRLLNLDIDKYVHLNCALWSSEVYETLNGALMNVDGAYTRGLTIECANCKVKGATVGCFNMRCPRYYHLGCAKKVGCMFFQNKTIFCPSHALKQGAEKVLESLSVFRRVYINRNEDKQVANMVHGQEEGHHILRIGSLILHNVGQLLPHQIQTCKFHTRDHIYPVGFKSSRYYWSMKTLYKRCSYVCSIIDNDGRPGFVIRVVEPGREDIVIQDDSPRAVWKKILEPLDKLRRNADLVKIFPTFTSGEELFGLTEPAIVRVLESLPGTDLLSNYNFKNSRSLRIEMPLTINPTGCARTEPKLRTHFRKPHTLQSSNTSRSLPQTVMGFTGDINSPYMKQFVHSKSQQYRRLKTEWKLNVYLGRSRIQGLGLFAARDLEKHTMVIEYIGDLIRNEVANRKEIIYEEQNRGVYMFRIDNDTVVDATMAGGPARYINHSCNPNCVAEVVPFDKESKIIIITNRRIPTGEELTYDYKFDFEDEQHKIPCCCGASGCRKWMN